MIQNKINIKKTDDYNNNHNHQENNNYDIKHEKKLVKNITTIKCEKNCIGNVEKWCEVNKKPKNNTTINTLILNEISLLKIKYPFLSDQQIRGKALVKFGIPCFMGDIVRKGTKRVVGKPLQELKLNPVHQPKVPPAFIMNRKSQMKLQKKKIKKIDSPRVSLLSSQKLSQIFSLQKDNKIFNDENKENEKSIVDLTPRKRMRYPFKKNLFNTFSSLDTIDDIDELSSSPLKRIKLEAKKVEDLSDDEYSCIFTPRRKNNKKINIIDKENITPKKYDKFKPTTLSQLPDDIRDEILFDPLDRKNKIARNLNDSMDSGSFKIDFFGKKDSFSASQKTLIDNLDEFSFDEIEKKLLDSPILNIKDSYSQVSQVEKDINWDDNYKSQVLNNDLTLEAHSGYSNWKNDNYESQIVDNIPSLEVPSGYSNWQNDNYKSQIVDYSSNLEVRSIYSSWQPTQQTQTSTQTSTVSCGNLSTSSTDNPWKNVTSQDFSDYERVNPWSQNTVKSISQELEEINSEDGEWNDSQKTITNDQIINVNEDSNDTIMSKKLSKLNVKMYDVEQKQDGSFVCCFMIDCRPFTSTKSQNELSKCFTLDFNEPFDKNIISQIINTLMKDDD